MRPLVHFKQVKTKTAIQQIVTTGLATHFIQYHPRKQQSVIFRPTKIFNVEIVSEYTLRYTGSCV